MTKEVTLMDVLEHEAKAEGAFDEDFDEMAVELRELSCRSEFRYQVIREMVRRLFVLEMPVERVKKFMEGVVESAIGGFNTDNFDMPTDMLAGALLKPFVRLEDHTVAQQMKEPE